MAFVIPIVATVAASAVAAGSGVLATAVLGSITIGQLLSVGITVAGGYLSSALAGGDSRPRVKAGRAGTISDAAAARWNVLGETLTAGAFLLYDASDDNELWQVICIACHEIEGIVEHRLDDEVVTLDGSGWVQTPAKWQDRVQIQVLDGAHSATFSDVQSAFSYWTSAHKGIGLAQVAVRQVAVPAAEIAKVYPGAGNRLRYSAVVQGRVDQYDPRDESTGYTDNAALHVLAHLRRASTAGGLGIPDARIDMASFEAGADVCDQSVSLKAGGSEARYRVSGIQLLSDDPRETLRHLLKAMDADLYLTGAGKIALRYAFETPGADETLTADHVLSASWSGGPSPLNRYNRVVGMYVSADHGYSDQTTPPFDATLATNEVRRAFRLDLPFVPSGTQAQRLAKRELLRLNTPYRGAVSTTLAGLPLSPTGPVAFDTGKAPDADVWRVERRTLGADLRSVQLEVIAKPDGYDDWDEATEEQDILPEPALGATDQILSAPTVTSTEVVPVVVNQESKGARIKVNYTALSADDAAEIEIEWSEANANDWEGARRQNATGGTVRTATLGDGETYDVRVRFVGPGGGVTAWTVEEDIDVIAYVDPPDAPTGTAANAVGAVLGISATAPDDEDHRRLAFWYSATSDFGTATLAGTRRCDPGATASVSVSPGPGTWYVWATSRNASGLDSTEDGPDSDTTT